jgi:hypothetical protein
MKRLVRLAFATALAACSANPAADRTPDGSATPALDHADAGAPDGATAEAQCRAFKSYDPTLVQWTKGAAFVFRGTVAQLNASTEPSVPATGLYIVHVDHQLAGDDFTATLVGGEVTVRPPAGIDVTVGTDAVFFANTSVIGMGVVVDEVGHAAPATYPAIETDVPEIKDLLVERASYDDLVAADLIVVGRVGYVGQPIDSGPASEHEPLWTDSNVFFGRTLRDVRTTHASPTAYVAVIRFASSDDIAWAESPKLTPNQQAIFIAHHDAAEGSVFSARSAPGDFDGVVYHPSLDVRDVTDAPYLAELLACPPPAL